MSNDHLVTILRQQGIAEENAPLNEGGLIARINSLNGEINSYVEEPNINPEIIRTLQNRKARLQDRLHALRGTTPQTGGRSYFRKQKRNRRSRRKSRRSRRSRRRF
jgi:hypothetical protein